MMVRSLIAGAVFVVTASVGSTSCQPQTFAPSQQHGNYTTCPQGWMCGTCPNGDWWGYDNSLTYTNDPLSSRLFFDDKHPCR